MVVARGLITLNSQRVDLGGNVLGVASCVVPREHFLFREYGAIGAAASQVLSFVAIALFEILYLSQRMGHVLGSGDVRQFPSRAS